MSKMEGIARVSLKDQVPLETPLVVQMHVLSDCNFKCNYCAHILEPKAFYNLGIRKSKMKMDVFKKAIDDLKIFAGGKIKAINIAGIGEPLLHPEIVEMVQYAKNQSVADRIEIVTNAVLLTNELSDRLIEAGVDRLRISLQGTSRDMYKKICKVPVEFEKLVSNIKYFYDAKKNTTVYVKIMDIALDGEEDRKYFYEIFSAISDFTGVEYAAPIYKGVEIKKVDKVFNKNMRGNQTKNIEVCPSAFYTAVIASNGDVLPCCNYPSPLILGNIMENYIGEIWNNDKRIEFLKMLLRGEKNNNKVCAECLLGKFLAQPEDCLDEYAEEILQRME